MADGKPTIVRSSIVGVTTLMAVIFYLDRNCISFAESFYRQELGLSDSQVGLTLSIFYLAYALGQVPSGWLTDRFGARKMLTLYILLWSLFTALTGLAYGFVALCLFRLFFGFAQAGGYPAAGMLVRNWTPLSERGVASGWVSGGGRIGGVIAPILTAYFVVLFVPVSHPSPVQSGELLDAPRLCREMEQGGPAAKAEDGTTLPNQKLVVGQILLAAATEEQRQVVQAVGAKSGAKDKDPMERDPPATETAKATVTAEESGTVAEVLRYDSLWKQVPEDVYFFLPLEREGQRLRARGDLSVDETQRLNRLVLEATYPESIRKIYVAGWRQVMWTYGIAGIAVAGIFWFWFRDSPKQHFLCNDEEVALIRGPQAEVAAGGPAERVGFPLKHILRSRDLWLCCATQVTVNFGWVFLVMLLPKYLERVHRVPVETRGWMSALVIAIGWVGMLLGGPLTDRLTRRMGLRWGRALPMGVTRFAAVAAYLYVLIFAPGPWTAVACFCIVAFSTDLGVPAIWAYIQDVGGKHTASVLGWGNMWGNFGAMAATYLLSSWDWHWVFLGAAASMLVSGLTGLAINAQIPIVREAQE